METKRKRVRIRSHQGPRDSYKERMGNGVDIGYEIKEGLDIYFENSSINEKKVILIGEIS